jgi:acyl-CoA dehydrogenase
MDVLGGKGIIRGPSNLLGVAYRHAPIAITVEGANLLTRALIIFGQGAVRCHPYVQAEMAAVQARDEAALGRALLGHAGHVLRNLAASLFGAGVRGRAPSGLDKELRLIARVSVKYALTADLAMGLLGGRLKRMELLSARLGDVLSCLYLAAACVWRFHAEADAKMLPFARAAIRFQLDLAAATLRDLYANLPSRGLRALAPLLLRGTRHLAPLRDRDLMVLADALRTDPSMVARLCPDMCLPARGGLRDLADALHLADALGDEAAELSRALRRTHSLEETASRSAHPSAALDYLRAADRVIQVDDFPPA